MFEPEDGILNQLNSSTSVPFFKTPALQEVVGRFNVAIARVRSRNEQEYAFQARYIRPLVLNFFDFSWSDRFMKEGALSTLQAIVENEHPDCPFTLKNKKKFNKQEAENLVAYYLLIERSTRTGTYQEYTKINHELLAQLRSTYPFVHEK